MRYKLVIRNLTLKQAQKVVSYCKKLEIIEESDMTIEVLE